MSIIPRDQALQTLIRHRGNRLVKIITGVRRCGKSFLLFTLFKNYLLEELKVPQDQIIEITLDDPRNWALRDPMTLWNTLTERIEKLPYAYVFIDEIQYCEAISTPERPQDVLGFYEVLNGLLRYDNVDVYVTGSNSKMLTTDVLTQFRGRGDEIHLTPLTFAEYFNAARNRPESKDLSFMSALQDYFYYGGLPSIFECQSDAEREKELRRLADEVYLKDLVERHHIRSRENLRTLLQVLASTVGAYVNPVKISNTFRSVANEAYTPQTIRKQITFLEEAYLLQSAKQFDIKGRKHIGAQSKLFFVDLGLRNAFLDFSQVEFPHLAENLIYNELLFRDYHVDVGRIAVRAKDRVRTNLEVDFVARKRSTQIYIQSAFLIPDEKKREQELRPFTEISDGFQRVIITQNAIRSWQDEGGIRYLSLEEFLLNPDSL